MAICSTFIHSLETVRLFNWIEVVALQYTDSFLDLIILSLRLMSPFICHDSPIVVSTVDMHDKDDMRRALSDKRQQQPLKYISQTSSKPFVLLFLFVWTTGSMLSKSILIVLFASLTCSTILPSQIDFSQIPLLKNENYHQYGSSVKSAKENSVHIFNAVHSAMRQWGSSYHHNGMSIIPAIVPAGINFYHGGGDSERIIGMEWLAFEVEHAEVFARSRGPPRDGDKGPDGNPRGPPRGAPGNHPSQLELIEYQSLDALEDPSPPRRPIMNAGYFHTYRTNRLLNLLYLDGMAAAKCSIGTLDTQDILLLNRNARTEPIWRDGQRGLDLCALGKLWKMPIDGFIRMEAGFEVSEIILSAKLSNGN